MDVTLRSVGCRLKLQALCTTATRVAHAEARCAYAAGRVEGSAAPPRDPPVSSHAFFTWLRVAAAAAAALLLEKLYCYCLCAIGCARCVKVLKSHDYLSFSHCLT